VSADVGGNGGGGGLIWGDKKLGSDDNLKVISTPVSHFEATLWVVDTESEIFLKPSFRVARQPGSSGAIHDQKNPL
jgi:hypothetical protein